MIFRVLLAYRAAEFGNQLEFVWLKRQPLERVGKSSPPRYANQLETLYGQRLWPTEMNGHKRDPTRPLMAANWLFVGRRLRLSLSLKLGLGLATRQKLQLEDALSRLFRHHQLQHTSSWFAPDPIVSARRMARILRGRSRSQLSPTSEPTHHITSHRNKPIASVVYRSIWYDTIRFDPIERAKRKPIRSRKHLALAKGPVASVTIWEPRVPFIVRRFVVVVLCKWSNTQCSPTSSEPNQFALSPDVCGAATKRNRPICRAKLANLEPNWVCISSPIHVFAFIWIWLSLYT